MHKERCTEHKYNILNKKDRVQGTKPKYTGHNTNRWSEPSAYIHKQKEHK